MTPPRHGARARGFQTATWIAALSAILAARFTHAQSTCAGGRSVSADTAGHCCWGRQAWSTVGQRCVGLPQCPTGMLARDEECLPGATPSGAVAAGNATGSSAVPSSSPSPPSTPTATDGATTPAAQSGSCVGGRILAAGHCCWPGQRWSGVIALCVDTPQCPAGLAVSGEDCVHVECAAGQTVLRGHCCAPGQDWSITESRCTGAPSCPAGTIARADACVAAASAAPAIVNTPETTASHAPEVRAAHVARPTVLQHSAAGFAVMVFGLVVVTAGGGAWFIADEMTSSLRTDCAMGAGCPPSTARRVNDIRTVDYAANGGVIGGGVLAAVGFVLIFAITSRVERPGPIVAVVPTADGVALVGRF